MSDPSSSNPPVSRSWEKYRNEHHPLPIEEMMDEPIPATPLPAKEETPMNEQVTMIGLLVELENAVIEGARSQRSIDTARSRLEQLYREQQQEIERLRRFETYVCQVIAMGNQADLTVESLPA